MVVTFKGSCKSTVRRTPDHWTACHHTKLITTAYILSPFKETKALFEERKVRGHRIWNPLASGSFCHALTTSLTCLFSCQFNSSAVLVCNQPWLLCLPPVGVLKCMLVLLLCHLPWKALVENRQLNLYMIFNSKKTGSRTKDSLWYNKIWNFILETGLEC